jgi:hypothetical protein
MKKIIVALGALAVIASLSSSPAGAGDVVRLAGAGVAVTGDPVPGSTLTAEPAAWSAQPDDRRYEWLRDGEDAVVSRDRSYTVVPADIGHTLVVVERVAVGSQLDETSSASPVVTAAPGAAAAPAPGAAAPAPAVVLTPAVNVTRPTISGRASVGRRLRLASRGTWNAPGHSYRYQWLRNGKAVRGASKTSYRLTKKDRRQRISVRVIARRSGYPTVSATSVRTSRIR